MAHQRLGQTETDRKRLTQAANWLRENATQEEKETDAWHNRFIAQCLYGEAKTLIERNKTEPKK